MKKYLNEINGSSDTTEGLRNSSRKMSVYQEKYLSIHPGRYTEKKKKTEGNEEPQCWVGWCRRVNIQQDSRRQDTESGAE